MCEPGLLLIGSRSQSDAHASLHPGKHSKQVEADLCICALENLSKGVREQFTGGWA
jgi:hypothetical protein